MHPVSGRVQSDAALDYRIHVRSYDELEGIVGNHKWHYEVIMRSQLDEYVRSLTRKNVMVEVYYRDMDNWRHGWMKYDVAGLYR